MIESKSHTETKGSGAFDAFLNLLSLITLGWMSIGLGITLFQIIDKFFSSGQINSLSYFSQPALKFGMASILIITPIFLVVINILHRAYKNSSLNPQSAIYRWLTYLVLLVAALNIIGRLIQLVFKLLDGDYTLSSLLKIFVVLVIAGCIFSFYIFDIKRIDYQKRSIISQMFFVIVVVVALASLVGGFLIVDSPAVARMKKQDQKRVSDLYALDSLLTSQYNSQNSLPEDLSAAKFKDFQDPVSGDIYIYQKLSDNEYEICASFSLEADQDLDYYRPWSGGRDWEFHGSGQECYQVMVEDYNNKLAPAVID